jgi:hypothetical protein
MDLWKTILAVVIVGWLLPAGTCRAQGFGSIEYLRNLGPGAVVPWEGAPLSERYGYLRPSDGAIYLNWPAGKFDYLEYIDRVERAEKFGYRIPRPPCGWAPVWSRRPW